MGPEQPELHTQQIQVGQTIIAVEIADTEALRVQGLSGRDSLPQGSSMWFVFEEAGYHGIWMKDMRFAVDIIFADANGIITMIYHTVSPDTYPRVFYPKQPARYVLELPAGFAAANGIAEGSKVVVQWPERAE